MKLTIITQYYKPEMGAPQNRLLEMAVGLQKCGADVSVVTGMPNYPTGVIFSEYKGKCSCTEVLDNIEVKRYWLYASNARKVLPRIWNMISFSLSVLGSLHYLRKRKNDLIIVESPPLTLGISAWILAKLSGAKLVTNISDLWPLSARELGAISGDGLTYKTLEKVETFLYRHSVLTMGQSQQIVDYIKEHGGDDRVYLFRNGVDPKRFENVQGKTHKDDKLYLVYTGLLGFAQGILDVCQNINFTRYNSELHIYGNGGELEAIKQYLQQNPDCGIFYHGTVSRNEIPAVLSQYDATYIPLVKDIFGAVPSKIYESMAAGLPIIFQGCGEGASIVRDNNIGWVANSKQYGEFAHILEQIRSDKRSYDEKSANCKHCAQTLFNRPKQVQNLFDKLQALCM